jgi:hypothetical protein
MVLMIITGNRYPPYLSMANEKICHNMQDMNPGKIIDCGMVLFDARNCLPSIHPYQPLLNHCATDHPIVLQ